MSEIQYQKEPDVSWRAVENESVLIHNKLGEIQVLNESGTMVWEHLEEGLDAIASRLATKFDVDIETARKDAAELIDQLLESRVARRVSEKP